LKNSEQKTAKKSRLQGATCNRRSQQLNHSTRIIIMKNKINTTAHNGAKIRFIDFMQLPIAARKIHIEKYAPEMADWQKKAVLH